MAKLTQSHVDVTPRPESTLDIMRGMKLGDWYLMSHNTYHHKPSPACIVGYECTDEFIDIHYRYLFDDTMHNYFTDWISEDDHGSHNDIEVKRIEHVGVTKYLKDAVDFAKSQGIEI